MAKWTGISEAISYRNFTLKSIKQIAKIVYEDSENYERENIKYFVNFYILYDDFSSQADKTPEIFDKIIAGKQIITISMALKTEKENRSIELRIREAKGEMITESTFSTLQISGDEDWVIMICGKIKRQIDALNNNRKKIYELGWLTQFLILLFQLSLMVLFSFSFIFIMEKLLRVNKDYIIYFFIIFMSILANVTPKITTNKLLNKSRQLLPSIEIIINSKTKYQKYKETFKYAIEKTIGLNIILPLILALIAFWLTKKL